MSGSRDRYVCRKHLQAKLLVRRGDSKRGRLLRSGSSVDVDCGSSTGWSSSGWWAVVGQATVDGSARGRQTAAHCRRPRLHHVGALSLR